MKKALVGATVAASAIGGMAGAIAFTPGVSSAQDDTVPAEEADVDRPRLTEALRSNLDALVEDGTITSDQADAVADHLATTGNGVRRGIRGKVAGFRGASEIADALGMSAQEVAEAIRDGQTIAELAETNGVDVQTIIDQIVASAQERVDAAVESGRIDAERAAEVMENAETRAEAAVNGEGRLGNGGPRGERGSGGSATPDDDTTEDGSIEPSSNTLAA